MLSRVCSVGLLTDMSIANPPVEELFAKETVKSEPAKYVEDDMLTVNWIELTVGEADVKSPDPKAKM